MIELLETLLGQPVVLEELKHKPGRRSTWRAIGSRGRAIAKRYESDRTPLVAARVTVLGGGPAEPLVPEVLAFDADLRVIVLTEIPGAPFRDAVLAGDAVACARVGAALARWHAAWGGVNPPHFRPHTVERELDVLLAQADAAGGHLGEEIRTAAATMGGDWVCSTVVHRDLYEEQVLMGERVGLIDLDDAALGPPELDLGNLVAHLELLGLRSGRSLTPATDALLEGYSGVSAVDRGLLVRLRRLSLLRLACIHRMPVLVSMATT
ncbi:MAG: phosphotransferase family protein [Acidimicrobiales bacterium]